jgi:peroxiredoxin
VFAIAAPAWRGANGRLWLALILGAGLALSAWPTASSAAGDSLAESSTADLAQPAELAQIDGQRPLFNLDDLNRRAVSLADQQGEIVLVHFFATWCEPCREELPALNRLVARSDPGKLRVLTISVAEVDVRVRNFVDKLPVNFPVLLDRDRSVARAWNVSALPTTFILDRNLKPRLFVERDYDWDRFDVGQILKSFGS